MARKNIALLAFAVTLACVTPAMAAQPSLTPSQLDQYIKTQIHSQDETAVIPSQGDYCPAVEIFEGHAACYVEYRTNDVWHLWSVTYEVEGSAYVARYSHVFSWRRRWVKCSKGEGSLRVPGILESNQACKFNSPAYYVGVELDDKPSTKPVGWQFTDSAGYSRKLAIFEPHKQGNTYTYRNGLGDAFRWTP